MRNSHTSADDWRAVADFLGAATGVDSLEELDALAPRELRRIFAADLVIWERFTRTLHHLAYRLEPDIGSQVARLHDAFLQHFPEHPSYSRFGDGLLFILSDFCSTRQFLQTGLWNEVYLHLRAKHQIGFSGRIDTETLYSSSANRLGRDFGPRDREIAAFVHPRLREIVRGHMRRNRLVDVANALHAFFQRKDAAFVFFDHEGRVAQLSASARRCFAELPGALGEGELPSASHELRRALRQKSGSANGAQVFTAIRLSGTLTGIILWLRTGPVLLLQSAATAAASVPLTRREAEILGWLGEGKTNADIGRLLGISPRTVEKHCSNLFAKIGVESRFAAALFARAHHGFS